MGMLSCCFCSVLESIKIKTNSGFSVKKLPWTYYPLNTYKNYSFKNLRFICVKWHYVEWPFYYMLKLEGLLICGCFPTKTSNIHWKKCLYISGHAQFKPVLFKSQLYTTQVWLNPHMLNSQLQKSNHGNTIQRFGYQQGSWNQYSTDTMGGLYFWLKKNQCATLYAI